MGRQFTSSIKYFIFLFMGLSMLAWNVRGIMSSAICLGKLLEESDCDIALMNEHKLLPHNRSVLNSLNSSYTSHTHCESVTNSYFCGRGGVAILYKKTLSLNVETLNDGNERIVGIKVVGLGPKPYFIFFCIHARL